jgi:hypothetical protein
VSASTLTIIIGRELAGLGLGTKLHRRVVNYAFEAAIKRRFIIARKCNCRIVELDLRKTQYIFENCKTRKILDKKDITWIKNVSNFFFLLLAPTNIGYSFKFLLNVRVEESIVNAPLVNLQSKRQTTQNVRSQSTFNVNFEEKFK